MRAEMVARPAREGRLVDGVHANFRDSARNLPHYLAFRGQDMRPLQQRLAVLGLSSLGRAEAHVLAAVDAVLEALSRLEGSRHLPAADRDRIDFDRGQHLLNSHADALLGSTRAEHPHHGDDAHRSGT